MASSSEYSLQNLFFKKNKLNEKVNLVEVIKREVAHKKVFFKITQKKN